MKPYREVTVEPLTAAESELVATIHQGPCETPYWSTFLDRLRQTTNADYVSLAFRRADAGKGEISVMSSGEQPAEPRFLDAMTLYETEAAYRQLQTERVYSLDEFIGFEKAEHLAFRSEFLAKRGYNFLRVVKLQEGGGASAWLAIARRSSDFEAAASELLSKLEPHFRISMRTLAAFERERLRADIAEEAVHRLNFTWLTFDARAAVVQADSNAKELLQTLRGASRVQEGAPLRLNGQIDQALRTAITAFKADPACRARAIHLSDEPWLDMLVAPIRSYTVSGSATPVAVAYIHGEGVARAQRCDQLMQLFGLSKNEALLALAISRGRTITEAAGELNLTVETARNYTKRIYSKTDTRSQADLVRLILASVVALA